MAEIRTFHIREMNLDPTVAAQKIVFDSIDDLELAHREINDGKDIYVILEDEVIKLLNQELSSKIYDGRIKLAAKYKASQP